VEKARNVPVLPSIFQETGRYKGVELNRGRHQTRRLYQARMEEFLLDNMQHEEFLLDNMQHDEAVNTALFSSYNFYVDFLLDTLKQRFAPITSEALSFFSIFDYQNWPQSVGSDTFNSFGDVEVKKLLQHYSHMYSPKEKHQALIEWLLFKTYAIAKVQQFNEHHLNNKESATSSDSVESEDDTEEEVHTFQVFCRERSTLLLCHPQSFVLQCIGTEKFSV